MYLLVDDGVDETFPRSKLIIFGDTGLEKCGIEYGRIYNVKRDDVAIRNYIMIPNRNRNFIKIFENMKAGDIVIVGITYADDPDRIKEISKDKGINVFSFRADNDYVPNMNQITFNGPEDMLKNLTDLMKERYKASKSAELIR